MNEVQGRVDELTKVVDAEKEARRPEEEAKRASVEARRSAREEQRNARRAEEDAVKAQMEEAARAAQVEKDALAGSAEVRPAEDEAGAALLPLRSLLHARGSAASSSTVAQRTVIGRSSNKAFDAYDRKYPQ